MFLAAHSHRRSHERRILLQHDTATAKSFCSASLKKRKQGVTKPGKSAKKKTVAGVVWNLADLYRGPDDPRIDIDRRRCLRSAERFALRYRGRIALLTARELNRAIKALEHIEHLYRMILAYAELLFAEDTTNPQAGRLRQSAREWESEAHAKTLFFTLEWTRIPEGAAQTLLQHPQLDGYRHFLKKCRDFQPHRLSEPEECLLTAREPAGRTAWAALFEKTISGPKHAQRRQSLESMFARLHLPRRQTRRSAARAITGSLAPTVPVVAHILNTVALDTLITARIRSYPHWLHERNLLNEIPDATVAALIRAVTSRYGLVQRYYRIKKKLLRLDRLRDFDRFAPYPGRPDADYAWRDARELLLRAYRTFSPALARTAGLFFRHSWIHAKPGPGKTGGAFSNPTVPARHPYILLTFSGTRRDVLQLAHEMGHGIHQYLARHNSLFNTESALPIAETAAVFSELLVYNHLIDAAETDSAKNLLRAGLIENCIATIFRQVALYEFETRLYRLRAGSGDLLPDQISALWMETQRELYGTSVCLGEHYHIWWACIPHFIHAPGYVYAYAFANLTALNLYETYHADPEFPARYQTFLKAGGRLAPHEFLSSLGIDADAADFFDRALAGVEKLMTGIGGMGGQA
jgi:oligoendopeptidase F